MLTFKYSPINVFSNHVAVVSNSIKESVATALSMNTLKTKLNKYWHGHYMTFNP